MSARILIIEDDPMIQKLERLRLEEEQYEVFTTADPEEGLDIIGGVGVARLGPRDRPENES